MTESPRRSFAQSRWLWFAAGFTLFAVVLFRAFLLTGALHFTTDDNLGQIACRKLMLPGAVLGAWWDVDLFGQSVALPLNWTNLWIWILPPEIFVNAIHLLDMVPASLALGVFLRRRGASWGAAALGALTAMWLGTNFTTSTAGHTGKYGVWLFAALFLWAADVFLEKRSWSAAALAGGALGMMFLEQADIALFMACLLGPYVPVRLWLERPAERGRGFLRLAALLGMAGLLAAPALWTNYRAFVAGVAVMDQESGFSKWDYITQWSLPPEDVVDFVAPGYTGWASNDPEGPYWGRMGRSAEWETTSAGFGNFRLDNYYLGLLPLLLAALALAGAGRRRAARGEDAAAAPPDNAGPAGLPAADRVYWALAALLALLLAFGKFGPLYRFVAALPGLSYVRNPVKWLHGLQWAVAFLAAAGWDDLLRAWREGRGAPLRVGVWLSSAAALMLSLAAFAAHAEAAAFVRRLLSDWTAMGIDGQADLILRNVKYALAHGGMLGALLAAGLTWMLMRPAGPQGPLLATAVALTIVATDAALLNRHYVPVMPAEAVAANPLVERIRAQAPAQRLAVMTSPAPGFARAIFNQWMTVVFPRHGIPCAVPTQTPRLPTDYARLMAACRGDPFRYWQLGAVGPVLMASETYRSLARDPTLRDRVRLLGAYEAIPGRSDEVISVRTAADSAKAHFQLVQLAAAIPRWLLVDRWTVADDAAMLAAASDPKADPRREVRVARDTAAGLPACSGTGASAPPELRAYRPGFARLRCRTERPMLLRVADRYETGWQARVDGRPEPVRRVDYMFQGVFVPAGEHTVELRYRDSAAPLFAQAAGGLLTLLAAAAALRARRAGRGRPADHG